MSCGRSILAFGLSLALAGAGEAFAFTDTGLDTGYTLDPTLPEDGTTGTGTATGGGSDGGRLDADTLHGLSASEWAGEDGGRQCATSPAPLAGIWLLAAGAAGLRRRQPSSSTT